MHRSAHETEWLERNADFLSEVETLAVELLGDLEVNKKPYSRCVSDFTPNDRMTQFRAHNTLNTNAVPNLSPVPPQSPHSTLSSISFVGMKIGRS